MARVRDYKAEYRRRKKLAWLREREWVKSMERYYVSGFTMVGLPNPLPEHTVW